MNTGLRWSLASDQGRLALIGEITEDSDFASLLTQLPNPVTIDLSQVNRINSCGVREWLTFVGAMKQAGKRVVLERCSVPIVAQLNMISNFSGGAEVRSVFAPYHCDACDSDHQELLEIQAGIEARLKVQLPCPRCGEVLEFDDFPEAFLAFRLR